MSKLLLGLSIAIAFVGGFLIVGGLAALQSVS